MEAGTLREVVTVQKLVDSPTTDATGRIDKSDPSNWETYITRYAEVAERSSREFYFAQQTNQALTELITLRADSETRLITSEMRVSWRSRTLNIDGPPIEMERRTKIQLQCVEPK